MKTTYTKKQKDVLELITHLILTKPEAVVKLLAKHGVIFSFKPTRRDVINQVIELLKQNNQSFNNDLEKLLSIHLEHKGIEIMALESNRALLNKEDLFLGGLVGGLAKVALGGLSGLFGGKKSSSGGSSAAGLATAAAQASQMKAEMEAKMQQMEADRRRQQEEAERRMREQKERQRREREETERRRREDEDRRRRAEAEKSGKGDTKSNNNTVLIIGGIAAVVVIGGIALFVGNKKPVVAKAA